jgi:hypothetical protein
VEQPKKPGAAGAAPTKDISDLKARLGLKKPDAKPDFSPGQGGTAPVGPAPGASPFQNPGQPPFSPVGGPPRGPGGGFAGIGPAGPGPGPRLAAAGGAVPNPLGRPAAPVASAPAAAPAAAHHDPFAGMRPQQGKFDLRSIDDGIPVEKMKTGGGKAIVATGVVVGLLAFAFGAGLGISSVGRANMNTANRAARVVKAELEDMQKTVNQIGSAFAASQQRMAGAKKDTLSFDPKLTEDLDKVKLDPRPDTGKIFRVDYYRLDDVVVDQLFNYYYDTIALYGEVERHIKRTRNDSEALQSFADKEGAKQSQNYGIVFDQNGKITVANLVEVGEQVCKGGAATCGADDLEGFKIRVNTGAPWVVKKLSAKGEGMVPLKPTPLMDAVMSGSPDQVRFESYKQRVASMRLILARITSGQKQLLEGVNKAANRPDVFAPF